VEVLLDYPILETLDPHSLMCMRQARCKVRSMFEDIRRTTRNIKDGEEKAGQDCR
jgi:hypothetical protein